MHLATGDLPECWIPPEHVLEARAVVQIDRLSGELDPLRRQLDMLSRRQGGCRALRATQFGIGPVTSVAIWAELGDVRRFGNSADVVRDTGLDITVY